MIVLSDAPYAFGTTTTDAARLGELATGEWRFEKTLVFR